MAPARSNASAAKYPKRTTVLPAIADTTVVLFGYFAALALLLAGAILAYRDRRTARPAN